MLALFLAQRFVPAHVSEATEPVDNIGGALSVLAIDLASWDSTSSPRQTCRASRSFYS